MATPIGHVPIKIERPGEVLNFLLESNEIKITGSTELKTKNQIHRNRFEYKIKNHNHSQNKNLGNLHFNSAVNLIVRRVLPYFI